MEGRELKADLEQLLEFSKNSGLTVFHNSKGSGASIPQHEHFQAIAQEPPLFRLRREYASLSGIRKGHFPDFFGAHVILEGGYPAEAAVEIMQRHHLLFQAHNIILSREQIILIPRRERRASCFPRVYGGSEMLGYFPFLPREKAEEMLLGENLQLLKKGYEEVLFPKDITWKLLA
ncbi:hypothetical protein HY501_00760 [Candidatus Woesearchaeota archaeon]|nr:hypothetical protein [Candidatus Woesearchaeota archaeon]